MIAYVIISNDFYTNFRFKLLYYNFNNLISCIFYKSQFVQIKIINLSNNFIESLSLPRMINKTAYLNSLTKEKDIEIKMESHKTNLKQMKSINRNQVELNPIGINKNKGKYIKNRRDFQIELQNEILTQKIQKIIKSSRNSKYFSGSQKYSKSLNGHVKRVNQQKINDANLKLLVRLEQSKPTYPTKQYLEDFEHLQKVQKKMSSAQFYLTDSPTFRKRKLNTNRSFMSRRNSSFGENSSFMGDKSEIIKENITMNDGKLWQIKIFKDDKQVKITGQLLVDLDQKDDNTTEIKLIKIPNIEANIFLRKYCDNKLHQLIKHLKVDEKDGSLILIVPQNNKSPSPSKLMNPEQKKNIEKKLNIEMTPKNQKKTPSRQIFNTVNKKPIMLEELPKFNNYKQEQITKVKSIKILKQDHNHKNQEKQILPKINSKKSTNQIKHIKQKQPTKQHHKQQHKDKGQTQHSNKQEIKIEDENNQVQQQEKYQEQFDQSMNNKPVQKKDSKENIHLKSQSSINKSIGQKNIQQPIKEHKEVTQISQQKVQISIENNVQNNPLQQVSKKVEQESHQKINTSQNKEEHSQRVQVNNEIKEQSNQKVEVKDQRKEQNNEQVEKQVKEKIKQEGQVLQEQIKQ